MTNPVAMPSSNMRIATRMYHLAARTARGKPPARKAETPPERLPRAP
jgi:hypothetical protein